MNLSPLDTSLHSRNPSPPRPGVPAQSGPVLEPTPGPEAQPVALAGAVPLPGLEPWSGYGRLA